MQSFVSILAFVVVVWLILSTCTSLVSYFRSPLRAFPGPVAARHTNIWRFLNVLRGNFHDTQIKLHRKYGVAVRMGPNIISLSDQSLVSTIFSTKCLWEKVYYHRSLILVLCWFNLFPKLHG